MLCNILKLGINKSKLQNYQFIESADNITERMNNDNEKLKRKEESNCDEIETAREPKTLLMKNNTSMNVEHTEKGTSENNNSCVDLKFGMNNIELISDTKCDSEDEMFKFPSLFENYIRYVSIKTEQNSSPGFLVHGTYI